MQGVHTSGYPMGMAFPYLNSALDDDFPFSLEADWQETASRRRIVPPTSKPPSTVKRRDIGKTQDGRWCELRE